MKSELTELGELTSELMITIEKVDYLETFEKEVRKFKDKAHLKGFRKGKTPISAIKRMYGKSILADVVGNLAQQQLDSYISSNKIPILGYPLSSAKQEIFDFNLKSFEDFPFIFDLGIAPEFDIVGIDANNQYTQYNIFFDNDKVNNELRNLQKRMGEQKVVDEAIQTEDIIVFDIEELVDDSVDMDRAPYTGPATIYVDMLSDKYKVQVIGLMPGAEIEVDIYELEKNQSEAYVEKYLLPDAPADIGKMFKMKIASVKRLIPAELNEEFFKKTFGEEISTAEDAREKIQQELTDFYNNESNSLTRRSLMESLLEKNKFDLPHDFLKRWLKDMNPEVTVEDIEKEYDNLAQNTRWSLIQTKILKDHDITIETNDVKAVMVERLRQQFSKYNVNNLDLDYESWAEELMQKNQKETQSAYNDAQAEKVMDKLCELVDFNVKDITIEEYENIVETMTNKL